MVIILKKKNNHYKTSLKYFKRILKYNKNISENEWDRIAQDNSLFSSFTLKIKNDVRDFEELKDLYK